MKYLNTFGGKERHVKRYTLSVETAARPTRQDAAKCEIKILALTSRRPRKKCSRPADIIVRDTGAVDRYCTFTELCIDAILGVKWYFVNLFCYTSNHCSV